MIAPALHEIAREVRRGRFHRQSQRRRRSGVGAALPDSRIPALLFFSDENCAIKSTWLTAKKVIVDKLESLAAAKLRPVSRLNQVRPTLDRDSACHEAAIP
jgi:hypothetical protein